jgi:hypothetical protein
VLKWQKEIQSTIEMIEGADRNVDPGTEVMKSTVSTLAGVIAIIDEEMERDAERQFKQPLTGSYLDGLT